MTIAENTPEPRTITLAAGAQAVINGALITASIPCEIEVGSGAFVLTGRSLWRERRAGPDAAAKELYFTMLEASASLGALATIRFQLFALLNWIVSQERTHRAQKECAACAAALIAGDEKAALASARRLAEAQTPSESDRIPARGRLGERREGRLVGSGA